MTKNSVSPTEFGIETFIVDDHAHHWLIAPQDGPSSGATCKSCGAIRDFNNAYVRTYRSPIYLRHSTSPQPRISAP
ncbi:MAG: hypothetical protein WD904_13995 [Dehalococcoidia bacterium]